MLRIMSYATQQNQLMYQKHQKQDYKNVQNK